MTFALVILEKGPSASVYIFIRSRWDVVPGSCIGRAPVALRLSDLIVGETGRLIGRPRRLAEVPARAPRRLHASEARPPWRTLPPEGMSPERHRRGFRLFPAPQGTGKKTFSFFLLLHRIILTGAVMPRPLPCIILACRPGPPLNSLPRWYASTFYNPRRSAFTK